ncbi:MAG: LysM peptidoglycan-binding domain-containing protein [Pseudomonadota bacterium]
MTNRGVLALCFVALIAGVIGVMQWGNAQRMRAEAVPPPQPELASVQPRDDGPVEEKQPVAVQTQPIVADVKDDTPAEPVVIAMDPAPSSDAETVKEPSTPQQQGEMADSVGLLAEPLDAETKPSPLLSVPGATDDAGKEELASLLSGSDAKRDLSISPQAPTTEIGTRPDAPDAPEFDVVRVEKDGSAIVAGRAAPGSVVTVTIDGKPTVSTKASRAGDFVTLFRSPQTGTPQSIQLSVEDSRGGVSVSEDTIVVLVDRPVASEPGAIPAPEPEPTVVRSTEKGIEIVSAPDSGFRDQISLDTISYSAVGAVVLSGRGQPGNTARIYANALKVADASIADDGTWRVEIGDIDVGLYILRVDEVDAAGEVASRFESPFQREFPDLIAAQAKEQARSNEVLKSDADPFAEPDTATSPQVTPAATFAAPAGSIVVQPGNNLWTIAEQRYGEGLRYTQIFRANSDQIRDPDLIYPGQVFTLPTAAE